MTAAPPLQSPVQRTLQLGPTVQLPAVTVDAAKSILEISEDEVLELIEDGHIEWAWDISTKAAKGRREVRILTSSLRAYQRSVEELVPAVEPVLAPEVVIFGERKPFLSGKTFYTRMCCSSTHMISLCRDKSLRCLPDTQWRRGPLGSPSIIWDSMVKFLQSRRIT